MRRQNLGQNLRKLVDHVDGPVLRVRLLLCGVLLFALGWGFGHVEAAPVRYTHAEILHALRMVESSGRDTPPDGDGGHAIGPYQIHAAYWSDSGVSGSYERCRERAYAERVITAYMRRFVPDAWSRRDAEVIARTHNGGPRGAAKRATDRYWERVRARLEDARR